MSKSSPTESTIKPIVVLSVISLIASLRRWHEKVNGMTALASLPRTPYSGRLSA